MGIRLFQCKRASCVTQKARRGSGTLLLAATGQQERDAGNCQMGQQMVGGCCQRPVQPERGASTEINIAALTLAGAVGTAKAQRLTA